MSEPKRLKIVDPKILVENLKNMTALLDKGFKQGVYGFEESAVIHRSLANFNEAIFHIDVLQRHIIENSTELQQQLQQAQQAQQAQKPVQELTQLQKLQMMDQQKQTEPLSSAVVQKVSGLEQMETQEVKEEPKVKLFNPKEAEL